MVRWPPSKSESRGRVRGERAARCQRMGRRLRGKSACESEGALRHRWSGRVMGGGEGRDAGMETVTGGIGTGEVVTVGGMRKARSRTGLEAETGTQTVTEERWGTVRAGGSEGDRGFGGFGTR